MVQIESLDEGLIGHTFTLFSIPVGRGDAPGTSLDRVSQNVSLSNSGPPETRLPSESAEVLHLVAQVATAASDRDLRSSLRPVVEQLVRLAPRSSLVWWASGLTASDTVERYAAFRVGYHRGLDSLRANGWRGSGFVRWSHAGNVGFLRCLLGLQKAAALLGESDEEERCRLFLLQLDPTGVPAAEASGIDGLLN